MRVLSQVGQDPDGPDDGTSGAGTAATLSGVSWKYVSDAAFVEDVARGWAEHVLVTTVPTQMRRPLS